MEELKLACMPVTEKNAEAMVKLGKYQQYYMEHQMSKGVDSGHQGHVDQKAERREERRRKAATGKGGGGTQGRETKTKAVKKHIRSSKHANNDSDSDDGGASVNKKSTTLEIISVDEIQSIIKRTFENEGLEDLLSQVASYLHGSLNAAGLAIAKELSNKLMQDANQNRKQTHSSAQDKINIMVNDMKLYEKGLKSFSFDQQPQFVKYLLKTFGGDVLAEFCKYAASQCNLSVGDTLTIEQRYRIINDLPEELMKPLKALNGTLAEQNLDAFYQAVDVSLSACEMILKKADKKKDKLLIQNHREKLIYELETCEDPALALHLATLAIFTITTQNMLHASGRQVPIIIAFLKTQLKEDDYERLQVNYDLVAKYLTAKDEEKLSTEEKLNAEMPSLKKMVLDMKKYK